MYTKHNDWFDVKVEDLTKNSHVKVSVMCDLCGQVKERSYQCYNNQVDSDGMFYCRTCANAYKIPKILLEKYGVRSTLSLKCNRDKGMQKCIEKYGVPFVTQNEEFKKKYMYGDRNCKWKDGRSGSLPDRQKDPKLVLWRRQIFKRYNYRCLTCKSRKNLNAHHFEGYDESVELRYDLDNGVALCETCHKDFHRKYGYGNNTYKQFMHWLERNVNRLWEQSQYSGK